MSIALLGDVYGEVRRLAIAGSGLAVGDFRLKKLLVPVKNAAAKAPVFGKVAEAVERLLNSSPQESADALLELNTLVSAILYTQGQTGAEGPLEPIETTDFGLSATNTGARVLKPLIEALTGTGSGRQEIITDAHQRGMFRDLRLIRPALEALDDGYAEIADFVAQQVLPIYGKAIYDDLKSSYDPKGKGGAARRLLLMHRLDREATRAAIDQALESGSKEVKLAALECLKGSREAIPYLLEQAKAKSHEIRRVALRSLAEFTDDAVVDALIQALSGKDHELASQAVSRNQSPRLLAFLLAEAEKQLAGLLVANKDEAKERSVRFYALLACFASRRDKQSVAFLTRLFERREAIGHVKGDCSGQEINRRIAAILVQTDSKPVLKLLVDSHATLPAELLDVAMVAAIRSRKPSEVYDLFCPYYLGAIDGKKKGRDQASRKGECVRSLLSRWALRGSIDGDFQFDDENAVASQKESKVELDPRWLDAAVQRNDLEMVLALARPNHKGACRLLSDALATLLKKKGDMGYDVACILNTMIRIHHPSTVETYLEALQRAAASSSHYHVYWLARLIPELPPTATPKIEALLPSLPEKLVDQLAPHLVELKAKSV